MNPSDTRKPPEEAIALLEETLEATRDGLLVLDLNNRIVRYNKQFIRMFGLKADDIDRRGMDAIVAALAGQVEDAGRLIANMKRPSDPALEVLDTLRFKDGRVFERFIAPHRVAGRTIGHVASYRDITQGVRAEQSLEEHRAFLEKAQEVAHIGSWVAELDGSDRIGWSKETYRIFGVRPDSFAGTSAAFFAFVHPDDLDSVRRASDAARGGDAPYDIEHRIVRGDGAVRWVHERADVAKTPQGRPVRMIGTVQDITDRRLLEEQLRQSQKLEAIGRLAGGIAHDINNSLTAIIGFTELALGALPGADPVRPDVEEIRRAAARAASVARQLLAFSRKQMLEPRVFSLSESVANLSRMFDRILGPSIAFTASAPPVLPPIYGDPGQIEQAILNVVINARDAMPSGGTLTLTVAETAVDHASGENRRPMPAGTYVALSIADSGCGMDADTKARVFEPFFTTKEVGKGTGLGLAMVYGTVRQSGGFIFVESAPGRGATFTMYFPVSQQGEKTARAATLVRQGPATILVVEDEPAVKQIVTTALRRKGHRVLEASSGEEGLAIAGEAGLNIDLLLTDVSMPGMGGIRLARELASQRPDLPIVVMSGFSEGTLKLREAGVAAVLLPKPFTPTELQRLVSGILAGRPVDRS